MGMIASRLAASSLIPESLKGKDDNQTAANCFRVVEQAARWGLSPFAVMDSASVVHGKLMWEGKLIAAAIKSALGVRLRYEYSGQGENRKVVVSGDVEGTVETIEGTVADWKTTGKGSAWDNMANRDQMLAYRGARQWARRHAPEVILGVYSPDEMEEPELRNVTHTGRSVTVREQAIDPKADPEQLHAPGDPAEWEEKPAEAIDPDPKTIPAEGKQKKDRHQRDCTFKAIFEKKTSKNVPFWVVRFDIGQKTAELTTFSETLAANLAILEKDSPVKITFTVGSKGDFQLEDYAVLEGGLI
jgi:hypothetical protein